MSRDACSVANLVTLTLDLATFQTPIATFFLQKILVTNLATWTNFSESLIVGIAATARDQSTHSSFSASALFSESLSYLSC